MNTETIWTSKGSIERIVRSKRIWKGAMVGAIHDKGYLIMVRFAIDGLRVGWAPIHVIRKIAK